jgi:DNA-damage-inducible protein J
VKLSHVSTQINPELKKNVIEILDGLGLTQSEAIRIFYKQIKLKRGLPFKIDLSKMIEEELE